MSILVFALANEEKRLVRIKLGTNVKRDVDETTRYTGHDVTEVHGTRVSESQWSIFRTDIFPIKTCQVKGDR